MPKAGKPRGAGGERRLKVSKKKIPSFEDIEIFFKENKRWNLYEYAEYQGYKAEYDIRTFEIIVGSLPTRANALVLEWASIHREELNRNWNKTQTPEELEKIKPLD